MSSDAELFLEGSDDAMAELIGRYERPLFDFLLHLTRDAVLAEDLFQETFLRLCRYRASFAPDAQFKPYLYRIALNVVRDEHARRKKVRSSDGGMDGAGWLSGEPGPVEACEREEQRLWIRAALARLPDGEREVVVLRVFQGLSFEQVAEATGVPVSTAKSRLRHALRRLRPSLDRHERESAEPRGGAS